jgi:hypothetical protein
VRKAAIALAGALVAGLALLSTPQPARAEVGFSIGFGTGYGWGYPGYGYGWGYPGYSHWGYPYASYGWGYAPRRGYALGYDDDYDDDYYFHRPRVRTRVVYVHRAPVRRVARHVVRYQPRKVVTTRRVVATRTVRYGGY